MKNLIPGNYNLICDSISIFVIVKGTWNRKRNFIIAILM